MSISGRYFSIIIALIVVICAAGLLLDRFNHLASGLIPMWWAAGGSLLAAIVSILPILWVNHSSRDGRDWPQAALGSMVLRLVLFGGFLLTVTLSGWLPFFAFACWLMVFYFATLLTDTLLTWWISRSVWKTSS